MPERAKFLPMIICLALVVVALFAYLVKNGLLSQYTHLYLGWPKIAD